jgi:DNA-directed RNA polymerase subunit RPC12/RpoP
MFFKLTKKMIEFSILNIPTVLNQPIKLTDILYNCPVCDYEIEIDMIVNDNSSIKCDNCDHIIKLKIKKI